MFRAVGKWNILPINEIRSAQVGTGGGDSTLRNGARRDRRIGVRHCQSVELAEPRSPIVCSVHLGAMQGALRQWGAPVTVDRLDAFVKTDMCLAHLAATGGEK
ncbi:hypothetical protein MKUB_19170 [Mycobacterium kubicae]|uniref:Uncharacterized protein n=1 Tax=Mycobacterium kubicae TaxID=120959 RepID=A0ABQ1BL58_9MYCO|nr:hypothetical protein MKUB_19170 [Mycobacterium kubicae]